MSDTPPDWATFGRRLSWAMLDSGVTQTELSRRTGINHGHIGKWMREEVKSPRADTVRPVACELGLSEEWLLKEVSGPPYADGSWTRREHGGFAEEANKLHADLSQWLYGKHTPTGEAVARLRKAIAEWTKTVPNRKDDNKPG